MPKITILIAKNVKKYATKNVVFFGLCRSDGAHRTKADIAQNVLAQFGITATQKLSTSLNRLRLLPTGPWMNKLLPLR
jgi:hypothetical protein